MRKTTWARERKPDNPKHASIARDFVCAAFYLTAVCTSPLEGIEEMPTKRLYTRRQLTERRQIILLLHNHRADVKAANCLRSISLSRFNRCTQERERERERENERVTEFHSSCKSSEEILIIVGKLNLQQ
jgi:hypothetical protein